MFRKLAIALLLLVVGLPALLVVSARIGLDRSLSHTRAVAALPVFAAGAPDGQVRIRARGLEFRARVAGLAQNGPGLLLLHGFPESSAMWEPLIAAAAADGFRVVAFDQRGYSPGARPEAVAAYALPELEADALAVADAVGFTRFHLAGHDWGSVVGWNLSAHQPERVLSWTSLSIPHPAALAELRAASGPPFYVRLFRMPGAAETLLGFGDRLLLRNALYAEMPAHPLDEYLAIFAEPGALTAALNWYRAMWLGPTLGGGVPALSQPVLYVYGRRDMPVFVGADVQAVHARFMSGPFEVVALDAGRWLMQEATEPVVGAVREHLRRSRESD